MLVKVKRYQPLESFGELALLTGHKRAAKLEVTSKCDAHFAVISKKDYKKAQYRKQRAILLTKINFLKEFKMFGNQ